ncbi:MAG: peptide deformylase [Patescibacteria group bacterium]
MPDSFEIITRPAPSLNERSVEVPVPEITTPEFQGFADKLVRTMHVENGIGIAAPQVGVNRRIIALDLGHEKKVLINPEIIKSSEVLVETEEGCLSVPGVWGLVKRPKRVQVRAIDRHGRRIDLELKNLQSVACQHEIDHLNGILFIQKTSEITKGRLS